MSSSWARRCAAINVARGVVAATVKILERLQGVETLWLD